jgi:hypothetical protein
MEGMPRRRGRKRKQLVDNFKEKSGYLKLKKHNSLQQMFYYTTAFGKCFLSQQPSANVLSHNSLRQMFCLTIAFSKCFVSQQPPANVLSHNSLQQMFYYTTAFGKCFVSQ